MSRIDKLIKRILRKPKDFTFNELKKLLNHFGYIELNKGKTSGSRVIFVNKKLSSVILIHRPHPENTIKEYALKQIIEELKAKNLI